MNKCNKIVQLSFILLLLTQGIEQFHQHKNQYFEDLPTFLLFPLAIFNNRQPVFWPLLVWFFLYRECYLNKKMNDFLNRKLEKEVNS